MSNLSEMLSRTMESLEDPVIPTGTWKAKIVGGKLYPTAVSQKSGNEYQRASTMLQLVEPGHDVIENDASKFIGEKVYFDSIIMKDADARQLLRTLKAVGVSFELSGTTEEIITEALRSAKGVEVFAEVEVETYEGKTRSKVKKIYALAA